MVAAASDDLRAAAHAFALLDVATSAFETRGR